LALIPPGLLAWIKGKPVAEIEKAHEGDRDSHIDQADLPTGARTCQQRQYGWLLTRYEIVSHVIEDQVWLRDVWLLSRTHEFKDDPLKVQRWSALLDSVETNRPVDQSSGRFRRLSRKKIRISNCGFARRPSGAYEDKR